MEGSGQHSGGESSTIGFHCRDMIPAPPKVSGTPHNVRSGVGIVWLPQMTLYLREKRAGLRVIGLDLQCFFQRRLRFAELRPASFGNGEIHIRRGITRVMGDRSFE